MEIQKVETTREERAQAYADVWNDNSYVAVSPSDTYIETSGRGIWIEAGKPGHLLGPSILCGKPFQEAVVARAQDLAKKRPQVAQEPAAPFGAPEARDQIEVLPEDREQAYVDVWNGLCKPGAHVALGDYSKGSAVDEWVKLGTLDFMPPSGISEEQLHQELKARALELAQQRFAKAPFTRPTVPAEVTFGYPSPDMQRGIETHEEFVKSFRDLLLACVPYITAGPLSFTFAEDEPTPPTPAVALLTGRGWDGRLKLPNGEWIDVQALGDKDDLAYTFIIWEHDEDDVLDLDYITETHNYLKEAIGATHTGYEGEGEGTTISNSSLNDCDVWQHQVVIVEKTDSDSREDRLDRLEKAIETICDRFFELKA